MDQLGWKVLKDIIGATLSCLCILHCALQPILIAHIPSLNIWTENETAHMVLGAFAFLVSGPTLVAQGNRSTYTLALVGFVALLLPLKFHELETTLTLFGSSCLILGHFIRHRYCQCCY